jgi:HPt (histidine-containing phosphotransfer) domain-containing protein
MTDDVIDAEAFERLREITGGDDAFLGDLIDTYLEDGAHQVADLLAAAGSADIAAMVRPAHTLKSASDSIGARPLADRCRALEAAARAGAVSDAVSQAQGVATAFEAASAALAARRPGG